MRKQQQKQILELVQTLKEAQSAKLYADCQDGALSLWAYIEEIEGADSEWFGAISPLLDEYCKMLYSASVGDDVRNTLRKQINDIENCVKFKLNPDRIEIMFLSYKASMSDSLESLYLAAKADPGYDAYWIPVPYYEFTPDRKPNKMVYEGRESYPEYLIARLTNAATKGASGQAIWDYVKRLMLVKEILK
ncbi:MAG: hypothetical protein LBS62_09400 [Clostridiales bacterium]|jgi:hypothetical protein|nr:hypothetical protein [Clostridiales bacterium]